ncbi:lipase chaperone [Nocardia donostiensis]|uniref:ARB-07466-like C-terminal domain-containing protein n=1 Tax=Nocardia donostiensis TaxID=1538463 RepID=A0A1V2TBF3_9NOCA|nr:hypothetical protein B0T46_21315 [Nocardia donostiensis]OQS16420.1 hypothetical protein B0T36_05715 [Nocardia donostiensis]OQS19659.1 hypothetical protein B0T44_13440 [Nocardia donostiensis]
MPGQHRKPTRVRQLAPLALCGVAAAAIAVLWMAFRPSPAGQHAAAVDSLPSSAVETGLAPTTTRPAPAAPAATAEQPLLLAKKAEQHLPPLPPPIPCPTELAGARPHVAQVGNLIDKRLGVADIGGAIGRGDGDHGAGLALDFMTSDPAHGAAIADFVLANQQRFHVTYVIWQQRYNDGNGWSYMEDRGSPTANHYDHVHVSFDPAADVDITC